MALFVKKHRSKAAKIVGAVAFILLMFFSLNISTSPNKQGDIDLLGVKVSLFTNTYAGESGSGLHQVARSCSVIEDGQGYPGSEVDCDQGGSYCTPWPCD
jgi:hypothetical protein